MLASVQEAELLAYKDKLRLLKTRKLTLVVDLDQTLIHTSTDPHIEPGLPDVYGFRLGGQPIVYHCRLRPHVREFLEKVSKLYELHVFTMATKDYAAAVIDILDPERHLFCDRIITRDEFFDPRSKALRFKYGNVCMHLLIMPVVCKLHAREVCAHFRS
jgi:RNA polymerase II subunit A-like phosphatase